MLCRTDSDYVVGISIGNLPNKVSYQIGEKFNAEGLKVVKNMASGATQDVTVTDEMLSGFDSSEAGTKSVKVTADGFSVTFNIEVVGPAPAVISPVGVAAICVGAAVLVFGGVLLALVLLKKKRV